MDTMHLKLNVDKTEYMKFMSKATATKANEYTTKC